MKRKPAALGIDFGTTNISAALIDLEEDTVLTAASEKADAFTPGTNPLYREQAPKKVRDALYRAVSSCTRSFEVGSVSMARSFLSGSRVRCTESWGSTKRVTPSRTL